MLSNCRTLFLRWRDECSATAERSWFAFKGFVVVNVFKLCKQRLIARLTPTQAKAADAMLVKAHLTADQAMLPQWMNATSR